MRLLLQVMFVQGYLWRDHRQRFPERLPEDPETESTDQPRTNWMDMGVGGALIVVGFLSLSASPVAGTAMTLSGVCVFLVYAPRATSLALGLSKPASTSLSWACASLFTILVPVVVVAAATEATWDLLVLGILSAASLGAHFVQSIEERYLFFADPENNKWRLAQRKGDSILERYKSTFITLPREIAGMMLRPSQGGER